ncbi:MAG: hypothetical protein ACI9LV_000289 [Candidatus Nanohaloarchaea archaeon]|jgi:hypothetical protein
MELNGLEISIPPIYGDGSDGSITRTTNGTENGILHTTDYTIEEGVTMTATGTVIIHATKKITINGTLEAVSENTGGSGGAIEGNGGNGSNGLYISNGGSGGAGGGGAGGLVYTLTPNLAENGTITATGGNGGIAKPEQDLDLGAHKGGNGADGADGQIYRINVS